MLVIFGCLDRGPTKHDIPNHLCGLIMQRPCIFKPLLPVILKTKFNAPWFRHQNHAGTGECHVSSLNCMHKLFVKYIYMMTSSNWNIFRVTGPLCGEITGPGEVPAQRPVTRSFDVFFDLRLNKRLRIQPWGWWFETPSWSLWRHRNEAIKYVAGLMRDSYAKCNGILCGL